MPESKKGDPSPDRPSNASIRKALRLGRVDLALGDTSAFAGAAAQVVKLGTTHHAAADHGAPIVCLPNRLVVQCSTPSELDALLG